jgi:hypothetical protein
MFHSYHQVANWCRMSFIHSMFPSIPMDPLTHSLEPSIGDSSLGTMPLGLIPAKRACIDIIYWYSKKCAWKWCDWTKTDKTMVMFRRKLSQGGIKFWSILPTLDKKCWYKFGCFPTGMAILILARFYLQ